MSKSITTRLIALLTLSTVSIVGLAMWLDYRLSRDELLQQLHAQSEQTVTTAIVDMENWLEGVESSTLLLGRILQQRDYSTPGLKQMLKDIVENNDDIFGSAIALNPDLFDIPLGFAHYYFRRDGILREADLALEENNYQQQRWYMDSVAAGKPIWVEPYFDVGGAKVLMTTYAVPVYRVDDAGVRSLYGVVTADVTLQELRQYLQRLQLGANGQSVLLSREGLVLGAKDDANLMRHYSEINNPEAPYWANLLQKVLVGQTISRQRQCTDIPGSCSVHMGTLNTGWPLVLMYSDNELLAPLHDHQIKTAITGLLTLLLMVLAVYFVTRRITAPLAALSAATRDISQGKLDTPLPAPKGEDEVATLIQSFKAMNHDLKTYIADLETVTASRSRLEGELAAAREIQMAMLPGGGETLAAQDIFQLWARVTPAKTVGGDLYSYQIVDGKLLLALGDVSDKGVPAALFMARAISLIQQLSGPDVPAQEAMSAVNDMLTQGNENCMFVTLFLGVLNLKNMVLSFASAGDAVPVLLRNGAVYPNTASSGPALGLASGLTFPVNTLQLQTGDRLAIYTDGIEEAFNIEGTMFGQERISTELLETVSQPVDVAGKHMFQAISDFANGAAQSDDITLMLLELTEPAENWTSEFNPKAEMPAQVAQWLQQSLESASVNRDNIGEFLLVAEEIVTNIYKYAGLAPQDSFTINLEVSDQRILLEVADRGKPFNPLTDAQQSPLGADIENAVVGGFGIHLITSMTEHQSYRRQGQENILLVEKIIKNTD